jgi:hypothetical protein
MIFDTLKNIDNYKGLGRVYTALEFLAKTDFNTMELGRYELDGDNIFYMVQSYDTDPEKTISEAHKKYIDIQFMVKGEELIGVAQMGYDENTQFTINVTGGNPQLNIASGNSEIAATQNIGIDVNQLEKMMDEIRGATNTEAFGNEEIEQITDSLDAIKAELTSLQPKKGILRTALKGLQAINGSAQFLAAIATMVQFVGPYIQ